MADRDRARAEREARQPPHLQQQLWRGHRRPAVRHGRGQLTDAAAAAQSWSRWWQTGVIYQVYPRSFQDSNGDGIGDLVGVIARLDHLSWLGVDAIWLSPIFRSPMRDYGYDVADYLDVDPLFGSLEDAARLIEAAHARGLRVLLDFVPNHTSSEHPWFLDARSSRESPYRDWYVWRDPATGGGPPNDMESQFGGSAWTLDEATGQYWYHSFLPEQPELDWRNPAVRAAMLDALRTWFARGIDGFRVDVLWMIAKDDGPWSDGAMGRSAGAPGGASRAALDHGDGPDMEARLAELRAVADEFEDRVLVGEVYMEPARLVRYYGRDGRGAHLPFNFALVTTPWEAGAIRAAIEAYERALPPGAWPNWVLGNHDQSRVATRVGAAQARVAAMLLLTLRGTPTLYQGDELGLPDAVIPPARVVDVAGRDPERSPMPWTRTGRHAGFSDTEPWLPLVPDPGAWSVEAQADDERSMLTLHRRLLALRRSSPALRVGTLVLVDAPPGVVAFDRVHGSEVMRVVLNLGSQAVEVPLPGAWRGAAGTHPEREDRAWSGSLTLAADEGVLLRRA
ncbi:MAG TPA: alpha-amylase family glycosyl hydrolase [Candidatus Limnocylindrales bacterium]|nr:alpha-amylase family glycosyl hydrolase [Candidatus Limnocylindrales bacterium]